MKKYVVVMIFGLMIFLSGCQFLPGANKDLGSIELVGEQIMSVEINSVYNEPGAIAKDKAGVASGYQILGEVLISTLGSYQLTYRVYYDPDDAGAYRDVTRVVRVVDTTPPVIEVLGSKVVTLTRGEQYVEQGFNVSDNSLEDLDATINITFTTSSEPGRYFVYYRCEDSSGNFTIEQRTVNIVE